MLRTRQILPIVLLGALTSAMGAGSAAAQEQGDIDPSIPTNLYTNIDFNFAEIKITAGMVKIMFIGVKVGVIGKGKSQGGIMGGRILFFIRYELIRFCNRCACL